MIQKRYMEIERIRDDYEAGFRAGDLVQISEKIDGSNGLFSMMQQQKP